MSVTVRFCPVDASLMSRGEAHYQPPLESYPTKDTVNIRAMPDRRHVEPSDKIALDSDTKVFLGSCHSL
jgi:hypothetical protein